jgi:hypothetical protein
MKTISSNQLLPIGTEVTVGNKIGTVVRAEMVPAIPCGTVARHTIHFTAVKINARRVSSAKGLVHKYDIKPMNKTIDVNYAGIWVKK